MKPKIGRKIYTVDCSLYDKDDWWAYIFSFTVGYLGKESFVVENYEDVSEPPEWYFRNYGETWFTSLKAAKAYARKAVGAKRIRWQQEFFDDDGRCYQWFAEAD